MRKNVWQYDINTGAPVQKLGRKIKGDTKARAQSDGRSGGYGAQQNRHACYFSCVKSATKIINTSLLSLSLCIVQAMTVCGSSEIL